MALLAIMSQVRRCPCSCYGVRMNDVDAGFLIKICGLSTPQTLVAALEAGADMIGLNFHPRSPRHVTVERAIDLAAMAQGRAQIVALIVDWDESQAVALVERLKPDWLQLHGRETPEQVRSIKAATGLPLIKALGIAGPEDLAAIETYRGIADLILLDAKPPKDAAYPGGHGRVFDWGLLSDLDRDLRFMLSGGLDPANVAQAIAAVRPAGVDVSSGVESAPGVKDIGRIAEFGAAARRAVVDLQKAGTA